MSGSGFHRRSQLVASRPREDLESMSLLDRARRLVKKESEFSSARAREAAFIASRLVTILQSAPSIVGSVIRLPGDVERQVPTVGEMAASLRLVVVEVDAEGPIDLDFDRGAEGFSGCRMRKDGKHPEDCDHCRGTGLIVDLVVLDPRRRGGDVSVLSSLVTQCDRAGVKVAFSEPWPETKPSEHFGKK